MLRHRAAVVRVAPPRHHFHQRQKVVAIYQNFPTLPHQQFIYYYYFYFDVSSKRIFRSLYWNEFVLMLKATES